MTKDIVDNLDRPIVPGVSICFASTAGRSDGTLNYGEVIKVNKASILVQETHPDGTYIMARRFTQQWDENGYGIWEETSDLEKPRKVNFTHKGKFHIL